MKICQHCRISIGGELEECPICQCFLEGESSENIWPAAKKLKMKSLLYRIHLFILISIVIVSLCTDLLLKLTPIRNWSYIVVIVFIMIELFINRLMAKPISAFGCIFMVATLSGILLLILGKQYHFLTNVIYICIPSILIGMMIPGFFLCLADKSENAMVYMLITIAFSIIPVITYSLRKQPINIMWGIAFCIALIAFFGLIIFTGRRAIDEIQKRLYF